MSKLINNNTPIEKYIINDITVHVKREDLSVDSPAPQLSKLRGLIPYLKKLKKDGIKIVGYADSPISTSGWGVAWACKQLGMKAVIFTPTYKTNTPPTLIKQRKKYKKFKAKIVPIRAGIMRVSYNVAKLQLKENYKNSVMLPMGLPFDESVYGTYKEVLRTKNIKKYKTIIIPIGKGTIAAGVWKGLDTVKSKATIYGLMASTSDTEKSMELIRKKAVLTNIGLFKSDVKFELIDEGWAYKNKAEIKTSFPCNPYYDLKAWQFLVENIAKFEQPILFWNIGQ